MASKRPEKANHTKLGGGVSFFSFLLALGSVPGGMVEFGLFQLCLLLQAGGWSLVQSRTFYVAKVRTSLFDSVACIITVNSDDQCILLLFCFLPLNIFFLGERGLPFRVPRVSMFFQFLSVSFFGTGHLVYISGPLLFISLFA